MFALSLALCLLSAPRQSPPDDPGIILSSGDDVFEGVSKPEPLEPFTQQQPFAQLAAYEPALKLLDADPLLARKISLTETYIPLRQLLTKASDKAAVLRVNGELAELRMQVSLKNRPLSVLMRSLARMLPGTWKKEEDGKTYTLTQTATAQKYQREWWGLWEAENLRVRKALQAYAVNFLKADPNKVSEYNRPVITNDASHILEGRVGRKVLQTLPESVQQRIANQFLDTNGYGIYSSSDEVEGAITLPYKDLPNECKDAVDKKFGQWLGDNKIDPSQTVLRLQISGDTIDGRLIAGNTGPTNFLVSVTRPDLVFTLRPQHFRLKPLFSAFGKKTPPLWYDLDKFAAAKIWKTPKSKSRGRSGIKPTCPRFWTPIAKSTTESSSPSVHLCLTNFPSTSGKKNS